MGAAGKTRERKPTVAEEARGLGAWALEVTGIAILNVRLMCFPCSHVFDGAANSWHSETTKYKVRYQSLIEGTSAKGTNYKTQDGTAQIPNSDKS